MQIVCILAAPALLITEYVLACLTSLPSNTERGSSGGMVSSGVNDQRGLEM